jgi:hypothetical protein
MILNTISLPYKARPTNNKTIGAIVEIAHGSPF